MGLVFQTLELDEEGGRFNNFIDFRKALGGVLNLQVGREVGACLYGRRTQVDRES